jgi:hypothetical protein
MRPVRRSVQCRIFLSAAADVDLPNDGKTRVWAGPNAVAFQDFRRRDAGRKLPWDSAKEVCIDDPAANNLLARANPRKQWTWT